MDIVHGLHSFATANSEIFARVLFSGSFAYAYAKFREKKSLGNEEITLSFTDIGKSCPSREFLTSQICLLKLFAKIKFSRNFQIYSNIVHVFLLSLKFVVVGLVQS